MSLSIYSISLLTLVTAVYHYFNFHHTSTSETEHFRYIKSSSFVRQYFYHDIHKSTEVIRYGIMVYFQEANTPLLEDMSALCCC